LTEGQTLKRCGQLYESLTRKKKRSRGNYVNKNHETYMKQLEEIRRAHFEERKRLLKKYGKLSKGKFNLWIL